MVGVQLDLRDPQRHLIGVVLSVQPRLPRLRLQLPGWTPGSYLIRDYVRQLEGLEAVQDGRPLALDRLGPAAWQLCPEPGGGVLEIRYRVLATELSVRTCHLDAQHGFLALAAVVLEVEGERWEPHQLSCVLPPAWQVFTPLEAGESSADPLWWAKDYDTLIDSPLEAGPHTLLSFCVAGVPHQWVCWAGSEGADQWLLDRYPTLLKDVERVCEACCRVMGVERPAADHYLFVLHLLDQAYGGLEHDNATVLVYGRRDFEKPNGYRRFLQLVAHEYLHQWNVRRLRPAELTPIDYHRPPVVPSLWFAEGVTSYLDQFLPFSAGLGTSEQLLEDLGEDLSRYRLTPGRSVQSLRSSSQEAWVKLYKADAYAADSQVSYYLKGAVVALCLDLHLRLRASSLATVLRQLWQTHGRWGRGYSEADLLAAFSAAASDLGDQLPRWLNQLDDPDLDGYLSSVGLRLEAEMASVPWAGMSCRLEAGLLCAHRVWRSGPAEQAGLMVGDEVLALDGERIRQPDQLSAVLSAGRPQALLIARRGQLHTLQLQSEEPQPDRYRLVPIADAGAQQLEQRRLWMLQVG